MSVLLFCFVFYLVSSICQDNDTILRKPVFINCLFLSIACFLGDKLNDKQQDGNSVLAQSFYR